MATYHDSTQASVTTTPNVSITAPTISDGDTVFLAIFTRGNTTVAAPPAGFVEVEEAGGSSSTTASGARIVIYRRYVATASGEPPSYTATMSSNCNGSVICVSVSGADPTEPVQVAAFLADGSGADAVISSPSVTTPADGSLLLRFAAMNTDLGVASWAAAGVTEDEDVATVAATDRVSAVLGHSTQASAGATGTVDWNATLVSGTSYGPGSGSTLAVGIPPVVASAGPDLAVEPGDIVTVDTSASTGPIVSRTLTQVSGDVDVSAHIVGATTATPAFIAPKPVGSTAMPLVFRETVIGSGNTSTDDVTVTVSPALAESLAVQVLDALGDPV